MVREIQEKVFLTKQFLLNQEKLIFPIWNKIYFFFKHYQEDIFTELKQKFGDNLILMNEFLDFASLKKQPQPTCFVFDDFLTEGINSDQIAQLYISGRHLNISLIFLSQNFFAKGKHQVTQNRNTEVVILMENLSDQTIIRNLAYKMYPKQEQFLIDSYNDSIKSPYGHLLINRQPNSNRSARVRGNIFKYKNKLTVYLPRKARK